MILSLDTQRDIRNAALSALHYIAYDQHCEVSDILALLSTTRIPNVSVPDRSISADLGTTSNSPSQPAPAPVQAASPPAIAPAVEEQAEEGVTASSATPSPETQPDEVAGDQTEDLAPTVDLDAGLVATPPQPTSTPAVRAQNVEPSSEVLDGPSLSPPGAERAADPAPVPSEGEEAGKPGEVAASPASAPKTQTARVVEAIAAHPGWTARQIGDLLGIRQERVNNIATKKHLTLRRLTPDEFAQSIRDAMQKTKPSVEPDDEALPLALTTPYSVAPKIAKRAPQGRFYLRDHDGRFVHQSLQASPTGPGPLMTSDRKWGWYDTMDRYRGAKKLWPQLAFMRKEAVQA